MQNLAIKTGDLTSTVYLSTFQTKVENLRQDLYSYAESFPSPLNSTLINHYKGRLNRAHGLPMLGEYAPFMVGDLFMTRPQTIERLAFPWLLLYEYTLLLDDLIDQPRLFSRRELVLSQMLLASSFDEYKRILGDSQPLWAAYDSYQREWLMGSLHEMDSSSLKNAHCALEVIGQQGRRAAIAKFCAASLVYCDENRLLAPHEERGIDHFCAGIMLLDDIADVLEDHKEGRRNFLLETTYEWFKTNLSETSMTWTNLDINQLTIGLVYSGAISRSWKAAANEIENALGTFSDSESQTTNYFRSISTHCRRSAQLIEDAATGLPKFQQAFLHTQAIQQQSNIIEIGSAILRQSWKTVIHHIDNGPKACQ